MNHLRLVCILALGFLHADVAAGACIDPSHTRFAVSTRLNVAGHLQVRDFPDVQLCQVLDAIEYIAADTDGTYSVDNAGHVYTPLLFVEGGIQRIRFNPRLSSSYAGYNDYIGVYVSGIAFNPVKELGCTLLSLCDAHKDVELGPPAFPPNSQQTIGLIATLAGMIIHEASHTVLGPHSDGNYSDKDMNHSYGTEINYLIHLLRTRKVDPASGDGGTIIGRIRYLIARNITSIPARQQFLTLLKQAAPGAPSSALSYTEQINWSSLQVQGAGVAANLLPSGTCPSTHFCWQSVYTCAVGFSATVSNLKSGGNFIGTPMPHITGGRVEVIAPKTQDVPLFGGAVATMNYSVDCK